jgi:SOS regulatory protein LexA
MGKIDMKTALEKIRDFFKDNDRLPSIKELSDLCGYASRNSAVYLINKLVDSGFLNKTSKGKLVTTSMFHRRVRLLGSVAAGFPTAEEEELQKTVSLDEFLVTNPTSTYMLQVKGDSMVGAGVYPGDYVFVERGRTPREGEMIIAKVDDEWTLKYYKREGAKVFLRAANTKYPDIYPKKELFVAGIVVSSCRKYA